MASAINHGEITEILLERSPLNRQQGNNFQMSVLLSGLYGMVVYLQSIAFLTMYIINLSNGASYKSDDVFNIYTSVVFTFAIIWMIGDAIYINAKSSEIAMEKSVVCSVYLKGGLVVFGFTAVLIAVLDMAVFNDDRVYDFTTTLRIIYVVLEMAYLINYSDVCVTQQCAIRRFGLMHIMVANLKDMTMNVIINAGLKDIVPNPTSPFLHPNDTALIKSWRAVRPYLLVCRLQYSFIAAGTVVIMWYVVGKPLQNQVKNILTSSKRRQSSWVSSVGLILGCGSIVGTIIATIISDSEVDNRSCPVDITYYNLRLTLNLTTVVSVIFLLIYFPRYYRLPQFQTAFQLDEAIILLCLFFYVLQEMFGNLSLVSYVVDDRKCYLRSTVLDALLTLLRIVLQTLLIIQSLRLTATGNSTECFRSVLLFLSIVNLAWWIISLTELNNNQHIYRTQKELFGKGTFNVIHGITGPFVVFYHYQSSVCIFEMWSANNFEVSVDKRQ
ncbi:proton channel OtopLc-like [Anneissia japonica]|uniref:proton channel OtopLc-like n=1 Tax=Anneissia japonica TaxID=1529436 RepID=UPI001425846A|nr:proton channel OtopLc-like [Anneissia japonica]